VKGILKNNQPKKHPKKKMIINNQHKLKLQLLLKLLFFLHFQPRKKVNQKRKISKLNQKKNQKMNGFENVMNINEQVTKE